MGIDSRGRPTNITKCNATKSDMWEQQHPCLLRFFFFLQSLKVLATAILLSSSSAIVLSSSSSARTEGHRNHYKVAADAEEGRRRRSVAKASQLNNSSPLLLTTSIERIDGFYSTQNDDRTLWKLGTLPSGLITFYNLTYPLDRGWHVLGIAYVPALKLTEIENAAVIHYNGNYMLWLNVP
ncbi:unnamed protein product [Lupinus luteus]|uniref:Hexosyltransferase n=1 Tax=Lupinus luteus TaxID=3873 RepID=A0AAV1XD36_LUPLU